MRNPASYSFYTQPHFHFSCPPKSFSFSHPCTSPACWTHNFTAFGTSNWPCNKASMEPHGSSQPWQGGYFGADRVEIPLLMSQKKHDMMALDKGCSENPIDLEIFRCSATTGRNHRIHEKKPLSSSSSSITMVFTASPRHPWSVVLVVPLQVGSTTIPWYHWATHAMSRDVHRVWEQHHLSLLGVVYGQPPKCKS